MAAPARALSALASMLGWVAALAYPLVVYWGLTHATPRKIALVLLAVGVLAVPLRGRRMQGRDLWTVVGPLLPAAVPLVGAVLLDDRRLLFMVPVVVNLALLIGFAVTLRLGSRPMVERFARLQEPRLPEGAVAYCRTVTWVWCGFFAVNATVTAILALTTPTGWALHTGVLAYVAIGLLVAGEIVVRKVRFRRYGQGPVDRLLAGWFPPRGASDGGSTP